MQNSNQYWGTNDQEILEDMNGAQFGTTMNESGLFKCQDTPREGDDEDEEDEDLHEEDQSDTIETDEDYPGPKESKIGHEEKPGINDQEGVKPN